MRVATMWAGKPVWRTPLLFAVGATSSAIHAASGRLNFFASMNLIKSVIAALHEHIRQQSRDQAARGDIVEAGDIIDGPQRREYLGSLRLIENRTVRSLQLTHRAVAVDRHEERVTELEDGDEDESD